MYGGEGDGCGYGHGVEGAVINTELVEQAVQGAALFPAGLARARLIPAP